MICCSVLSSLLRTYVSNNNCLFQTIISVVICIRCDLNKTILEKNFFLRFFKMFLFGRCTAIGLIVIASCVQLISSAVTTTTPSSTTPSSTSSSTSSLTSSTAPTTNLTDPCRLNVDPGPCFGKFLKFYFNSDEQKCKAFYFGGCYGNANQVAIIPTIC